jgi:hypothetical protein
VQEAGCSRDFRGAFRKLADCLKQECGAAYVVCFFCAAVVVLRAQDAPFKAARNAFHVVHEMRAEVDKCIAWSGVWYANGGEGCKAPVAFVCAGPAS